MQKNRLVWNLGLAVNTERLSLIELNELDFAWISGVGL